MKKTILAISALLISAWAAPAMAGSDFKLDNAGAAYGFGNGGVLSAHADFDVSRMADMPLKARFGYDRFSTESAYVGGTYTWAYNIFYAGAYYDFSRMWKLPKKVHPFAGLGLDFSSSSQSFTGAGGAAIDSGTSGLGLYYIGGVQYDINREWDAELSFSGWGGLSIGANYQF